MILGAFAFVLIKDMNKQLDGMACPATSLATKASIG
jgi:hypothetical protein